MRLQQTFCVHSCRTGCPLLHPRVVCCPISRAVVSRENHSKGPGVIRTAGSLRLKGVAVPAAMQPPSAVRPRGSAKALGGKDVGAASSRRSSPGSGEKGRGGGRASGGAGRSSSRATAAGGVGGKSVASGGGFVLDPTDVERQLTVAELCDKIWTESYSPGREIRGVPFSVACHALPLLLRSATCGCSVDSSIAFFYYLECLPPR